MAIKSIRNSENLFTQKFESLHTVLKLKLGTDVVKTCCLCGLMNILRLKLCFSKIKVDNVAHMYQSVAVNPKSTN